MDKPHTIQSPQGGFLRNLLTCWHGEAHGYWIIVVDGDSRRSWQPVHGGGLGCTCQAI